MLHPSATISLPTSTPCAIDVKARSSADNGAYLAVAPNATPLILQEGPALHEIDIQYLQDLVSSDPVFLSRLLPGLNIETAIDFARVNSPPPTTSQLTIPFEHVLFSDKAVHDILGDDLRSGWERFHARYPTSSGLWALSAVGLSCDADQALVFVQHVYGYAGMTGTLYLLSRESGTWTIIAEYLLTEA
jgi:hypothetical protein